MNTFTLILQDAARSQHIERVRSFVGEDASGSFGILANHARMMTTLVVGLARYCSSEGLWSYVAMPGAVAYFHDNVLTLSTRHYLCDDDYMRISTALRDQLLVEEEELRATRESLQRMEDALMKRLWEMGRGTG